MKFFLLLFLSCTLLVAGCGKNSPPEPTPEESAPNGEIISGPECSFEKLSEATTDWASKKNTEAKLQAGSNNYACSGGWAVAFPEVPQGEGVIIDTVIFRADDKDWRAEERESVCVKQSSLPEALRSVACPK